MYIAFEISANYNNEKINAVLNIDLKNDLKIQLKTSRHILKNTLI